MDNASGHGGITQLSNLKNEYLPPNTTSALQPMDHGIIKVCKGNYGKNNLILGNIYLNLKPN